MTPSTAISTETRKRKRPPNFQHLPAERAKKLKRDWVESKKIKSKWRNEKRKEESRGTARLAGEGQADDSQAATAKVQETDGDDSDAEESEEHDLADKDESPETPAPTVASIMKQDPLYQRTRERWGSSHGSRGSSQLRSSHSSGRTPISNRGRGRERGRGSGANVKGQSGRGNMSGRGKQPDMGAKMGTLLEKIKKDYA